MQEPLIDDFKEIHFFKKLYKCNKIFQKRHIILILYSYTEYTRNHSCLITQGSVSRRVLPASIALNFNPDILL